MKVAIVGAGLIGRAWAVVFARGGASVSLFDQDRKQAEAALRWVDATLPQMQGFGLIADADIVRSRIGIAAGLDQAAANASHVQENIVEKAEPKQKLFALIEEFAPLDCVLASSSSAITPSVIFSAVKDKSRCLVAHPLNPPHLAPVVELCGGSEKTKEKTSRFMRLCGMSDVIVQKEIEGFILNRLQYALLNEALRLIEGGYVSAADLDKTVKDGLALRWSFMGPIETIDLNAPLGVADYMARYGETIRRNGDLQKASTDWTDAVSANLAKERREIVPLAQLSSEQAVRDRRLMALARLKRLREF
jgi:L-gulonate 3-dehydrogenase